MVFPITSAVEGTGSPPMSGGLPTQSPVAVIPNRRGKKLFYHSGNNIWVKEKIGIGSTSLYLLQTSSSYSCAKHRATTCRNFSGLRCFNTVFQRLYRYFSIALKILFSASDRYKIFTSNWLWIEICENIVLSESILLRQR